MSEIYIPRTRIISKSSRNGQTAMDAMKYRDAEELSETFLHVLDTSEDEGDITYVFRWTVRDYARIMPGIHYRCHYIRIGKSIHNLRILRHESKLRDAMDRKWYCILLGLTPVASCAKVSFTLIGSRNKEFHPENKGTMGHIPDRKCFYEFIESKFLTEKLDLVAVCKITVAKCTRVAVGIEKSTFFQDFEHLYECELFSDIKLCVGSKEFDVHRVVLAARSPVFAAMLRYETKENTENRIEIEDSNEVAVGELLRYIYAEKTIPFTIDLALDLFELADKYDIQTLKLETANYLRCNFSIENVLDILVAADLHDEKTLKMEAIEFVSHNMWYLLKSPKWKTFRTRMDLVDCILAYLSS